MFEGVLPAIITPFKRNEHLDIDTDGLRSNIEFLLAKGVHGIVPCGSTGESATLSAKEHEKVIEITIDAVNDKVPVIAGTGSNNTDEAVLFTKAAKNLGADGVLVISPYYNKPNRSGLIRHYTRIADLDIPVILYNVPGRTGQNISTDVVVELARHPSIVGIKEASQGFCGDSGSGITQVSKIIEMTRDENFRVISGDDGLTFPILALGGAGVISVAANVEPALMVAMYEHYMSNQIPKARDLHYYLSPLFRAMFIDTNPVPVKKAMELRGHAGGPPRLPLDELDQEKTARLQKVLQTYD
jgi:4-hydroxy-tetrahydrodipicolinate synthase